MKTRLTLLLVVAPVMIGSLGRALGAPPPFSNGTNRNVPLKFITRAKTTLEAAKGSATSDQLADVKQAITEALKRVAK
jgi:hypothetical protein